MTRTDWLWIISAVAVVLIPSKYDPAIRIREWLEKKRHK